jgi:hypothetical protein
MNFAINLPVEEGTFDIVHDQLGIIATITITEVADEQFTVEIDETPL